MTTPELAETIAKMDADIQAAKDAFREAIIDTPPEKVKEVAIVMVNLLYDLFRVNALDAVRKITEAVDVAGLAIDQRDEAQSATVAKHLAAPPTN